MIEARQSSNTSGLPDIDFGVLTTEAGDALPPIPEETKPKKRGRPKKETPAGMVPVESDRELSILESNRPFIDSYKESQEQLRNTITGIDALASQISKDLQDVRASRALKRKYEYICELSSTIGSLVGNRITAIREINNTITQSHKLDMDRNKQMKAAQVGMDDDKAIMDMYRAFVNTPVGSIPGMPPTLNVPNTALNNPISAVPIQDPNTVYMNEDMGYQQFLNTPSPELNAVHQEQNPNIKPVVMYNQESGEMFFDVQDVMTGQSYPNIQPPPPELIMGLKPDLQNGVAKNPTAGLTYDMRLVGNRRFNEF